MDKTKRQKLDDEDGGGEFDQDLLQSIEKLQEVQEELEKVNEEASDKILEVEQQYNEIRRPVYKKRSDVIATIPDFWLTAFLSHPELGPTLTPRDKEIFKYLVELNVEDHKDIKSGYSITFAFKKNPYFVDEKLAKSFKYSEDGTIEVSGQGPKWKEGEGNTNGAGEGDKKRGREDDSFFNWFDDSEGEGGDSDEIAELIKDDLWPNPLRYFNNEGMSGDDDEDGEEDGDEDGEED